jgi:hypothetical protein
LVETLTESFCERCGTRYEFRAPTRLNPLRKTRGFIGGLKNYLTSQDALSDAMGDAMRSEEDQLASAQLDAFHETFNFCITCRQYTCLNCWNDAEGRCRTCAPIAGTDDLTERLLAVQPGAVTASAAASAAEPTLAGDEIGRRLGFDDWPTHDVEAEPAANGDTAHAWPETDPLGAGAAAQPEMEPEPVMEAAPEPEPILEPLVAETSTEPPATLEPVVAEDAEPWVEPEPWAAATVESWGEPEPEVEPEPIAAQAEPEAEPEPIAAQAEPEPWPMATEIEPEPEHVIAEVETEAAPQLRVVAWEADSAYDVVEPVTEREPEPEPMVAEAEPEPEPIVAEAEPAPIVAEPEVEPEPIAAETEPEPEPIVAEAAPEPMPRVTPINETIVRFPDRPATPEGDEPGVAAAADSPELAARRAQLDLLGLGDPGEGPVTPERPAVLPYRSRGAAATPAELAMRAGGHGFWEASAREVAGASAQIGVQNCGECGLSLSATARFCRRCGTRQARSA